MPVDVFRTIVGMKAEHDQGKLIQQLLKHGAQVSLGYLLNRTNNLKPGDFIHRVNVVKPFNAVQIALVNRVYPNITGLARRVCHAAHPVRPEGVDPLSYICS